jgi:hypothetical protein
VTDTPAPPWISVLVPVWQTPEPLGPLYYEYAEPLRRRGWEFEFVFVCEPRFNAEIQELLQLVAAGEPIRILQVAQTLNEASLYHTAAAGALGSILVTLPAYRRIEAEHLAHLITRLEAGPDIMVARRWPRKDAWINRLQNRALHTLLHFTVGGNFRDVACGVRAMRREVLMGTPVYGDSFRFFGLLARQAGFQVEEMDAPQHERDRRTRVYSPGLYLKRLVDLLGLYVILRFTSRPLRFFGPLGGYLTIGGLALVILTIVRGLGPIGGSGRILLLIGVFLLVLGIQTIAIGVVGEMMVFLQAPLQARYRVVERVN